MHGKNNIKHVSHFTATSACVEPSHTFGEQATFDKQIFRNGTADKTNAFKNVI
jgi:hypothetical protein